MPLQTIETVTLPDGTDSSITGAVFRAPEGYWAPAVIYTKGGETSLDTIEIEVAEDEAFTTPYRVQKVDANTDADLLNVPLTASRNLLIAGVEIENAGQVRMSMPSGLWARLTYSYSGTVSGNGGTVGVKLGSAGMGRPSVF